ncbi:hypothetical protein ACFWJ4_13665 [Kitasatospora sp. NPDC127067]|uniref:hypothetical protein n=1 Tax=Kitasatospora sp. NPDC127067 TaxID=3347126 RepID=UPI00364AAA2D
MGLSISVGLLHDQARNDAEGLDRHRSAFGRLGQALPEEGIGWHEPEITDPPRAGTFSGGFPYGYLTEPTPSLGAPGRQESAEVRLSGPLRMTFYNSLTVTTAMASLPNRRFHACVRGARGAG